MSSGLDRVYNDDLELTHVMCPICFAMTPIEDLWRDDENERWDLCSEACARKAGMIPNPPEDPPEEVS